MIHLDVFSSLKGVKIPVFDEGLFHNFCTHNERGEYKMPSYVEIDLKKTSVTHIRLLIVRDMRTGAYYTQTIVWCPTVEVAC